MHLIVRTRTGDQLHTQWWCEEFVCSDGSVRKAGPLGSRTSCGARVARVIDRDVAVRPGLLCEKCFPPARLERGEFNVKLVKQG